jgi:hypothetical protein
MGSRVFTVLGSSFAQYRKNASAFVGDEDGGRETSTRFDNAVMGEVYKVPNPILEVVWVHIIGVIVNIRLEQLN